ncbi:hypothetical protein ACFLT9_12930 [Acidobacteriota bacterium]
MKNMFIERIVLSTLICMMVLLSGCSPDVDSETKDQNLVDHPLAELVPGFHLLSYTSGSLATAAEFVGVGCKKLALSPTLSEDQLEVLLPVAEREAGSNRIPIFVERSLLVTKLFPSDVAKDKIVILMAHTQAVLDEYFRIKADRVQAEEEGLLSDIEDELAWRFGKLLSYTDETIERLISEQK